MLAEQLQGPVTSRVITEQAKGVLAERSGLDLPDAFAAVRSRARRRIDGSCARKRWPAQRAGMAARPPRRPVVPRLARSPAT
ncbi:ANTAR domain-containing protein [Amycolatopsis sp.]|uniref:ANTAR domain-containing protein n=1 Tax=Amycolatopsis sp. TaxID=37632 RepID=UPI0039C8997A